jgi:Ankyrin repeats (3 copies)
VDRVSASLDCHEHIPLDVRHAMMNKYRGPEDPNFRLVSGRIKDVVDRIQTEQSLTKEEQECMRALSFPYQDQKDMNPERVKHTCTWFLQHERFITWRQATSVSLLWVTAGPGCGKSVLSKALVDEGLLYSENPDTRSTSICYFFFKDDAERGNMTNALRSILHQLFRQKPWLIQHAMPHYKTEDLKSSFRTLWDIFIKAVTDANAGPVICVFDALDECEPSNRTSLIKCVSSFYHGLHTTKSNLKFILTSRPYHELEIDFDPQDLPSIQLDGNEMSEVISREVGLVISHEINRIGKARRPPLQENVITTLIENLKKHPSRTYLWAYLMIQEISRSFESTEWKLAGLLKIIPRSVDEAYEKILKRASEGPGSDPAQARRVLRLILAAERPLTLKEMNIALEILDRKESGEKCTSEYDLQLANDEALRKKIENLCGLFVSIVDSKIYLIHQTAKEFLVSKNVSTDPSDSSCWKHSFTPEDSHLDALKVCLYYLQLEFRDIPPSQDDDTLTEDLLRNHPLLSYASIHWTFHFRQAENKANNGLVDNALQVCDTTSQSFSLWFYTLRRERYINLVKRDLSDLMVTCYFGLAAVVRLLLERNSDIRADIDINSKDYYNRTALSLASQQGHEAVVKLLLDSRADIDIDSKDRYDRTALSLAAQQGHEAMVKLLLDSKADIDIDSKDDEGRTALSWAAQQGHEAVVKLLQSITSS